MKRLEQIRYEYNQATCGEDKYNLSTEYCDAVMKEQCKNLMFQVRICVKRLVEARPSNVAKWMTDSEGNSVSEDHHLVKDWIEENFNTVDDFHYVLRTFAYEPNMLTADDFEAYEAWLCYFDSHKDVYGVKARHTHWSEGDKAHWEEACAKL